MFWLYDTILLSDCPPEPLSAYVSFTKRPNINYLQIFEVNILMGRVTSESGVLGLRYAVSSITLFRP